MDFTKLKEEYKYRTELHAHSYPASRCGKFSPEEVVRIYSKENCQSLAITNHLLASSVTNSSPKEATDVLINDYRAAKKTAKEFGINLCLGAEIRCAGSINDYLVFGIDEEDVEKMTHYLPLGIEEFYKGFKNDRNVIIQAHPFRDGMSPIPEGYVDGIEVFNMHAGHNSRVSMAAKYAKQKGCLVTGGSDFHEEGRHAGCIMLTKHEIKNSYDIAETIKSRDYLFDVFGHIIVPYL